MFVLPFIVLPLVIPSEISAILLALLLYLFSSASFANLSLSALAAFLPCFSSSHLFFIL
jgi:hypothetical protein